MQVRYIVLKKFRIVLLIVHFPRAGSLCPLLITSTVAVKSEHQGTFFQDFLSLSGYLCSVPEMLRTTMKPNGLRYLRWGGGTAKPSKRKKLKQRNCLKNAQTPQRQVHAVLA